MTGGRRTVRAAPGQARTLEPPRLQAPARSLSRVRSSRLKEMPDRELCVPIHSNADTMEARRQGRELAVELGFSTIDRTFVATAISELARNLLHYAGEGEIRLRSDVRLSSVGIAITASDRGPGIADVRKALQSGHSASRRLGLGLPGVRRIMDEFDIESKPRQGTTITVKKWKTR